MRPAKFGKSGSLLHGPSTERPKLRVSLVNQHEDPEEDKAVAKEDTTLKGPSKLKSSLKQGVPVCSLPVLRLLD